MTHIMFYIFISIDLQGATVYKEDCILSEDRRNLYGWGVAAGTSKCNVC